MSKAPLGALLVILLIGCGGETNTPTDTTENSGSSGADVPSAARPSQGVTPGVAIPDAGLPSPELQQEQLELSKARNAGDLEAMNRIAAIRERRNTSKHPEFDAALPQAPSGWSIALPGPEGGPWQTTGGEEVYKAYFLKNDGQTYNPPWKAPHVSLEVVHVPLSLTAGESAISSQEQEGTSRYGTHQGRRCDCITR